MKYYKLIIFIFSLLLISCDDGLFNSPYLDNSIMNNTLYSSFSARPKHLDPAKSYSSDEWTFIQSVYETPLQYHYLKRPYQLEPNILTKMPVIIEKDNNTVYRLNIKKGIYYQPHPAFVKKNHELSDTELSAIHTILDFKKTATRELTAKDFVYQIKRLAHPKLHSPVYSLMKKYIIGLSELNSNLKAAIKNNKNLDLTKFELKGVKVIDKYNYEITIKGKQPQFIYWLAMPFFTAMPSEADKFYSQKGLIDKNIILDWYPIGTGAFMLTVNNPNREMILVKNPNFHLETYPNSGEDRDKELGLLTDANKKLPFLDKIHFVLEKESIPYWNKFLQGYYDRSGISSDNFDQAININTVGKMELSTSMQSRNMTLLTSNSASIYYTAFNMLDDVVGGYSEKAQKLRQAISIALDEEEYISIFANSRGTPAHGPIPPGIFGNINDYNNIVYEKSEGKIKRKNISHAKKLLADAGYKNGIDSKTNKPLLLYFDTTATGAGAQARLNWLRKQFKKLNIQLSIRATSFNRFQDKMRRGQTQLFELGWNADYPDPENFLFLLYGPNSKAKFQGENGANYDNSKFNKLFEKMRNMENTPKRQEIINQMVEIVRKDAPWVWGFIPKGFGLYHSWLHNAKPNIMAKNTLKYLKIDTLKRVNYQKKYNKIAYLPLIIFIIIILIVLYRLWKRQEN